MYAQVRGSSDFKRGSQSGVFMINTKLVEMSNNIYAIGRMRAWDFVIGDGFFYE